MRLLLFLVFSAVASGWGCLIALLSCAQDILEEDEEGTADELRKLPPKDILEEIESGPPRR